MPNHTQSADPNPTGLCMCGCGAPTPIARVTDRSRGHVRGKPIYFIRGHAGKYGGRPEYVVDPETGCWVWQHGCNQNGYGRKATESGRVYAHRHFYEQRYGPIPADKQLDHVCRNRACVNPDHLQAVDAAVNTQRGAKAKLTAEHVQHIRAMEGVLGSVALAERYGVHPRSILQIWRGKAWREPMN